MSPGKVFRERMESLGSCDEARLRGRYGEPADLSGVVLHFHWAFGLPVHEYLCAERAKRTFGLVGK